MSFEVALRATEILLALAMIQQSAEHLSLHHEERLLFLPRIMLAIAMLIGVQTDWILLALVAQTVLMLVRFQGPYNGGSDRMGTLILFCLCLAHWLPERWREMALAYLAVQLVLSYFISGQVKIVNRSWRSGLALQDVFRFSAYPVSEDLRRLADRPRLLWAMSWAVMGFEVAFPIGLLDQRLLITGLAIAALFHLANACLFGLNRFLWAWIAAYPSILWFQARMFG